ncbi:unnamed protein product [Cuscuta epithymum]|uniref:F-box domain-containing protein n=1 Tax=Cuscuta epithymum TaxID=186058 RepID=A0AAV0DEA6_9ASTE|nr:unnamed protein product [Cuscuta epithymum]
MMPAPLPNQNSNFFQLSLLNNDILFEILARLGAKSRGKLCCVSKSFRCIITDPSFVEFHRNWSTAASHGTTVLFSIPAPNFITKSSRHEYIPRPEDFYTVNFKSNEENQPGIGKLAKRVRHMDRVSCFGDLRYGSSAADRICLFNGEGVVVICNLCTGQQTPLPPSPAWSESQAEGCALLGLDGSSDTFKVLKLEACFSDCTVKQWVLTLGLDATWREIKGSLQFYPYCSFTSGVCINSVIYFYNFVRYHLGGWSAVDCAFPIVAFDVRSETFRRMPLPPITYETPRWGSLLKSSFLELDGQLAILLLRNNMIFMWNLDIVANSASCWKTHTFPIPSEVEAALAVAGGKFSCTLTTTPTGEIVLLMPEAGISSLWVLFDKFKPASRVWKKFGIKGLKDFPNLVSNSFKAIMVQNIAEAIFHLE